MQAKIDKVATFLYCQKIDEIEKSCYNKSRNSVVSPLFKRRFFSGENKFLYGEQTMKANEIYMRDPFIFVEDGVAYLVGTTDENAWGGPASGFLGYKTEALENFEGPFTLFET